MEPFAGSLATFLILTIFVKSAQYVAADATVLGLPVWKAALAIHITAWIIQFIGHGVFEGNSLTIIAMKESIKLPTDLTHILSKHLFLLQEEHLLCLTAGTRLLSQHRYLYSLRFFLLLDTEVSFMSH